MLTPDCEVMGQDKKNRKQHGLLDCTYPRSSGKSRRFGGTHRLHNQDRGLSQAGNTRMAGLAHRTARHYNPEDRRGSPEAVLLTYHAPHIEVDSTEQSKFSFQFHLVQHFCTSGWQGFCALPRKGIDAASGQFGPSVVEPNCHKEKLITATGTGWRGSQPSSLLPLYVLKTHQNW